MRISDWSSDVCSSDLVEAPLALERAACLRLAADAGDGAGEILAPGHALGAQHRVDAVDREFDVHQSSPPLKLSFVFKRGMILLVNRSEEHTSELQSLMRISYAVFCLKKKNNILNTKTQNYKNIPHTTQTL